MPTPFAQLTKAATRELLSRRAGDWFAYTTSGSGSSTTAVVSGLIGQGVDLLVDKWLLLTSGTYVGQFRRVIGFAPATGTIVVANAFGGTVASGVTMELHTFRPDLYTDAVNHVIQEDEIRFWKIVAAWRRGGRTPIYSLPSGMANLRRVSLGYGSRAMDDFDRSDSTTDPGSIWTAEAGTWGVSSERLYTVTDTTGDLLLRNGSMTLSDVVMMAQVTGTLASNSDYRCPQLVFRYLDSSNFMFADLYNSTVRIGKVDGGSLSALTTASVTLTSGTYYKLTVMAAGERIRVWVDDVEKASYALTGADGKYLDGGNFGVRLYKGGSPATAARWGWVGCWELTEAQEYPDWEPDYYRQTYRMAAYSQGYVPNRTAAIYLEGTAPLTKLAADSTGTINTDSTATIEIETTDPVLTAFVDAGVAALYEIAARQLDPSGMSGPALTYLQAAQVARQRSLSMAPMPQPTRRLRHANWQ